MHNENKKKYKEKRWYDEEEYSYHQENGPQYQKSKSLQWEVLLLGLKMSLAHAWLIFLIKKINIGFFEKE